ncbi:MAG: hypothetical protein J1F16_00405 [Muribaculaceae bacterium]|nr:hypothetical protein [Muribaculaceae bacterium]
MRNDSAKYTFGESEKSAKEPRATSISFIRQFARVYSTTEGLKFSYYILN